MSETVSIRVAVNGRTYERAGAPRLLFIIGSGGVLRQKPGIFEGPLAGHFDMLAHDQRGLGQSDIPDGPYSMADYAEDAAGLLDAVGWESCAVIGTQTLRVMDEQGVDAVKPFIEGLREPV